MKTAMTLSALTLGLTIAGYAVAMPFVGSCDSTVRKQVLLAKYDTVAPVGQITLDEVQAVRLAKFQAMDTDGNGSMTLAERNAYRTAQREAHFTASDTDGDGQVSLAEFLAATPLNWPEGVTYTPTNTTKKQYKFNRMDTDANGYITLAELQALTAYSIGRRGHHIYHLDNDGNGEISQAEFLANVRIFDRLDIDEDGIITEAEIDTAPCGRGGYRGGYDGHRGGRGGHGGFGRH